MDYSLSLGFIPFGCLQLTSFGEMINSGNFTGSAQYRSSSYGFGTAIRTNKLFAVRVDAAPICFVCLLNVRLCWLFYWLVSS